MSLAFIQGIGPLELVIVLAIVLLILGPKRLPGLGRSLGTGMREFKSSITGRHGREELAAAASDRRPGDSSAALADDRPLEGEVVPERR